MIKAMIFDFDGTIADTLPFAIREATEINRKLKLLSEEKVNVEEFRNTSSEEFFRQLNIPKFKLILFTLKYLKMLNSHIEELTTFPDMQIVLKILHDKKIKMGILTTNTKSHVKRFLKDDNIEYFDFINRAFLLFEKDKALTKIVRKLKLNADELVYIGDETRDVIAAKKAGVKSAAVTWGYNFESILKKQNPDYIINQPRELLNLTQ